MTGDWTGKLTGKSSQAVRTLNLRRVVVTGLGAIAPAGNSVPSLWDSLVNGRSGIDAITLFEANSDWGVRLAGEVRGYDFGKVTDPREARRFDRFALLALGAALEASQDSGFDFTSEDPYRQGIAMGSGIGASERSRRV